MDCENTRPMRAVATKRARIIPGLIAPLVLLATPWTALHAEVVPGLNITVHTYHPKVTNEAVRSAAKRSALAGATASDKVSASAAQQIKALDNEKTSRTAAQKKVDSRLLQTIRMLQDKPIASGILTLETDVELDDNNNLYVDITAIVSANLLSRLQAAGVLIVRSSASSHSIRALVPFGKMEEIATWSDIRFISPRRKVVSHGASKKAGAGVIARPSALAAITCANRGSVVSEADKAHKADIARSAFGICGDGVKIGVLSDGVDGLASSQSSGNLGAVTVLPGEAGSGAEGTAMLELIHDLAPNAQLYFASGGGGASTFEDNIRALRIAGCDIIVDDLTANAESPFQDGQADSVYGLSGTRISTTNGGAITQAVNDVVAAGALYFSSAGNEGNLLSGTSGTWQGDFSDGGAASALLGGTGNVHQFAAGVTTNRITSAGSSVNLYWADPLGGSNNDYDLYVLDSTGTSVVGSSTNLQDGTQDPYESVGGSAVADDNLVVIVKKTGANRFLYLGNYDGELEYATTGQILGHNGSRNSLSVAAAPAAVANPNRPGSPTGPYPNAFTAANSIELFSSDGPRHIFFEADGTPITGDLSSTGGEVLNKPDFTAGDGTSVTGAAGFTTPFFGTSAAAPHAAAIAALIKSRRPTISNAEVIAALNSSAIDIMGAGWDATSGQGIVMAYEAITHDAVAANPTTNVTGTTATATGTALAALSVGTTGCAYASSQFTLPPAALPAGVILPQGVFDFTANGCTVGSTITVSVTYPQALPVGTVLWKYGPTLANTTPHWYQHPATVTGNTITYNVTDGGAGDSDLTANGSISDPAGPGSAALTPGGVTSVPTLREWALGLLSLILGLAAWPAIRRRSL